MENKIDLNYICPVECRFIKLDLSFRRLLDDKFQNMQMQAFYSRAKSLFVSRDIVVVKHRKPNGLKVDNLKRYFETNFRFLSIQ